MFRRISRNSSCVISPNVIMTLNCWSYYRRDTLLIVFLSADGFNGYYGFSLDRCRYSSWDLSDLEYIRSIIFNKVEFARFNSTVGKFVGYTEFGVHNAETWNNDSAYLAQERAEKDRYCKPNAQVIINAILTKKGE